MRFIIARNELNSLIFRALSAVGQKPSLPIIANFLVEAASDEVVITSTDLTVGIRCFAKAKVLEPGSTTIPAKRFSQLMRELTAENVEIFANNSAVIEIRAGSSLFKIHGTSADTYPSLPDLSGSTRLTMKQGTLREMFFRTAFAVSREDNRFALMGVHLSIKNGYATFSGTDGKRVARAQVRVGLSPSFIGSYTIPIKAVDEILRNLEDTQETEVTVYLMDDRVAIEVNQTTLITKLLAGEYPDLERIIPRNSEKNIALHRDELTTLLRQVSLFAPETNSVRFTFQQGELKLSSSAMDIGEGKVSMPVNFTGPQMEIAFNPNFFLDILRHSKQETVTLGLSDPYNPGIITEADVNANEDQPSPLFVLMPVRLQ